MNFSYLPQVNMAFSWQEGEVHQAETELLKSPSNLDPNEAPNPISWPLKGGHWVTVFYNYSVL